MRAIEAVWPDRQGRPRGFRWRRRYVRVATVLESWREVRAWWRGEPELRCWRVEGEDGGIYELAQSADGWWMLKVYD
ncbi:MAG: DUF6504 family protein [Firmicutes bacterium]|nr:hypothetical protein [Alicyclobacillaceae bacterium]MCL6496903.1 DUF6504 family protein [Bacillota bacterium]